MRHSSSSQHRCCFADMALGGNFFPGEQLDQMSCFCEILPSSISCLWSSGFKSPDPCSETPGITVISTFPKSSVCFECPSSHFLNCPALGLSYQGVKGASEAYVDSPKLVLN